MDRVNVLRVKRGKQLLQKHKELLRRVYKEFGVPAPLPDSILWVRK